MKIVFSCLFFIAPSLASAFSLNDVTVLLPLPTTIEFNETLQPTSGGEMGILFPKEPYAKLPRLLDDERPSHIYEEMLRVVAVRLDPCFVEGRGPRACQRQIRLVWQPLYDWDGEIVARDAAVHTFYVFNDSAWLNLLQAWKQISNTPPSDPLQVHPLFKAQGYAGPYWQSLKRLLLEFCGEQNLTRATAMNVMNGEQVWAFAGVDINGAVITPIAIPRIGRNVQGLIMGTSDPDEFIGSMRPAPKDDPVLESLLMHSESMRENNELELKDLMKRIYAFENPIMHNPGTLDCVSCHVAQAAREWHQRSFPGWNWKNDFQNEIYSSRMNITNVTVGFKTNQFRALGYFHKKPLISQRVINETAETVATFRR